MFKFVWPLIASYPIALLHDSFSKIRDLSSSCVSTVLFLRLLKSLLEYLTIYYLNIRTGFLAVIILTWLKFFWMPCCTYVLQGQGSDKAAFHFIQNGLGFFSISQLACKINVSEWKGSKHATILTDLCFIFIFFCLVIPKSWTIAPQTYKMDQAVYSCMLQLSCRVSPSK